MKFGNTPIIIAVEHKCTDLIKLLAENGADLNKANSKGKTPLKIAYENDLLNIASLLVDLGAKKK
jgi:ankyrin repeat protein